MSQSLRKLLPWSAAPAIHPFLRRISPDMWRFVLDTFDDHYVNAMQKKVAARGDEDSLCNLFTAVCSAQGLSATEVAMAASFNSPPVLPESESLQQLLPYVTRGLENAFRQYVTTLDINEGEMLADVLATPVLSGDLSLLSGDQCRDVLTLFRQRFVADDPTPVEILVRVDRLANFPGSRLAVEKALAWSADPCLVRYWDSPLSPDIIARALTLPGSVWPILADVALEAAGIRRAITLHGKFGKEILTTIEPDAAFEKIFDEAQRRANAKLAF